MSRGGNRGIKFGDDFYKGIGSPEEIERTFGFALHVVGIVADQDWYHRALGNSGLRPKREEQTAA